MICFSRLLWSGIKLSLSLEYYPDDPFVLVSFAVRVYSSRIAIGARDHRARLGLTQWKILL